MADYYVSGRRLFRDSWVVPLILVFIFSTQFYPLATFRHTFAAIACAAFSEWLLHHPGLINGAVGRTTCFVGIISYSLYLWHQPFLLTFADYLSPGPLRRIMLIACLLPPIFLLSIATYYGIEKPWQWVGKRLAKGALQINLSPPPKVEPCHTQP